MQTRASPALNQLHSLAREACIPGYEHLSKNILFEKLKEQCDYDRLQRAELRRKKMDDSISEKKRRAVEMDSETPASSSRHTRRRPNVQHTLNKTDPIMFTPIRKKFSYIFSRPNGSTVAFNVDNLVDYMLSTGDFSDPETRLPFTDNDLRDIDALATKLGLQKQSTLDAKNTPQAFTESKFRRDALLGLERCAGEVVTDILNIIETCDPDEAQMRLVLRELPMFADYYRQLRDADPDFALQCMAHWQQFLEGPPNRPNEDLYGLIEVVSHFIRGL